MASIILLASTLAAKADAAASDTEPAPRPAKTEVHPLKKFSHGVAEVLKMVDAKVSPQVILTYIKHSPVVFTLSPDEIVTLKHLEVPDQIVAAMVEHGAESRAKYVRAMRELRARQMAAQAAARQRYNPAFGYRMPAYPNLAMAYPGYGYYGYNGYNSSAPTGEAISVNNSAGILVNGQIFYNGMYVPGYGYIW